MQRHRNFSYGYQSLTLVDRFGVFLSHRAIERHLPKEKFKLLDVGCGYNAKLLMEIRPRLELGVGVDVSIKTELRKFPELRFYEMTFEDVRPVLEKNFFDIITMISVIEHVWRPLDFLRSGYELLKPGGKLIVNVPTWLGKSFLEFSAFTLKTSPASEIDDHKMYYDKRDLWPLLVQAGFKPSSISLTYHKFGLNLFAICHKEED